MTDRDTAERMAQKFRSAEEKVAEKHGGFSLFGLFERARTPGRWNLVVSAPWLAADYAGTKKIIALLRDEMDTDDWEIVASVFPIDPVGDFVRWITRQYQFSHEVQEVFDRGFSDASAGHAFLITSNPSPAPARTDKQTDKQPVAA